MVQCDEGHVADCWVGSAGARFCGFHTPGAIRPHPIGSTKVRDSRARGHASTSKYDTVVRVADLVSHEGNLLLELCWRVKEFTNNFIVTELKCDNIIIR